MNIVLKLFHKVGGSDLFHLTPLEKRDVYLEVRDSYQIQPGYLLLILTAALIALLGLLTNSAAVVIGAMLISPLMNPFLSGALALTLGDWNLGRRALRTILLSIGLVLLVCVVALFFSPLKEATPEILARTRPNLMDLLIAFFAGIAGTYTLLVRKGFTTIPGVAIATAVMPPLCTAGFGIYELSWPIAAGALALFVTNMVAIVVSSALMFALANFRTEDEFGVEHSGLSAQKRVLVSFSLLLLISIPLFYALSHAVGETRERRQIENALRQHLELQDGARLERGWEMQRDTTGRLILSVVLRTPNFLQPNEVSNAEKGLEKTIGSPVTLQLSQVRVRSGGVLEPTTSSLAPIVSVPVVQPPPTPLSHIEGLQYWIEPQIKNLKVILGTDIDRYSFQVSTKDTPPVVSVRTKSDSPLDPGTVAAAQRVLRQTWSREGFVASAGKTVLRVSQMPATEPFLKIQFSRGSRLLPKETQELLERYMAFLRASPMLRPVLVVATVKESGAVRLQQRRQQAVMLALKKKGVDQFGTPSVQISDSIAEDEIGLHFSEPNGD